MLDFGSSAFLALQLRGAGLTVVTAAPKAPPANSLFRSAGVSVVQSQFPDACFRHGAFDLIVCKHFLEHELNPAVAISAMLEILGPDGSLVIQVPNANSWQAVLLAGSWAGFDIPRHPLTFDVASLEALLESCGLSIASTKPCSCIEATFCLATSLCPWLDPELRQLLGRQEHRAVKEVKDLCYCLVSLALLPLALLELASGSSPAILVEARRATRSPSDLNDQQEDTRTWNPQTPTAKSEAKRHP